MATPSKADKDAIKKLKAAGVELTGEETSEVLAAKVAELPPEGPEYSKADKAKIKKLAAAGTELTGTETSDELDTLVSALELTDAEEITEQEELAGVPNKLPVKTEEIEVAGKKHTIGVYFVAAVKGGQALYDYMGRRASPVYGPDDVLAGSEGTSSPTKGQGYINKAAAKFNAMRRRNILPGDTV